eukprot:TRINITY_DN7213_c0_g1_i1.p1 TRINITY_DN7213_c0_g1~~TRINITY_DN7213_c0_g1_i1.p1  ORF type:complete len:319 (+),score=49.56 TRINITY_DN7213_c0_g1_i1:119-1075(+)
MDPPPSGKTEEENQLDTILKELHVDDKNGYRSTKILMEPYTYLLKVPGKDVRGKLIDSFNVWLKIPTPKLQQIKNIVTILHTSSLLIDDIEDNSDLRRGVPVAHAVYGVPSTINCANYMYFLALQYCASMGNLKATQVFLEEMINLHHGQGYDIFWRDHQTCPTEQEYKLMVLDKTGGLFRLAVKLMQCFTTITTDYIPLVNQLALFFQIRDDYVNLQSTSFMDNKGFCEDLTEGKYSFPIIHSIRSNLEDHRLLNILKQRTTSVELKKYAVKYMEESGSFVYTLKMLREIEKSVGDELKKLGGNPDLEKILGMLSKI